MSKVSSAKKKKTRTCKYFIDITTSDIYIPLPPHTERPSGKRTPIREEALDVMCQLCSLGTKRLQRGYLAMCYGWVFAPESKRAKKVHGMESE